jgi:hypothetical protein
MKLRILTILIFLTHFTHAQSSCVGTPGQVKWSYWLNFREHPDSLDLAELENFPTHPDGTQTLGSLKAPQNFAENFASMIRGFIYVPTTATYQFNVTGDDQVVFYLSTNDLPINKRKRAEVKSYTEPEEHNKETNQTSQGITLVGGQNYYFEMYNYEGGWSDHMTLFWRKTTNPDQTWLVIDYNSIKEYTCGQNCPVRGIACNDNNPLTTNDQQDGFCNCVGTYTSANACVGTRSIVEAYYYDNIAGTYVEPDLTSSPKFPLVPDRRENLLGAYGPLIPYSKDNYGTLVQGFLTVPVTGTYQFNITGDNQTYFFLSKNDSIQYKQYHQAIVIYGVDEHEHDNSSFQTISPLVLEKGKFYYYEFRHKENGWRDHFNLYWKTPFYESKEWKRVPNFYLYDYNCEISCIAANTLCDDGNPYTKNDKFNNNCQCVGTPCTGPDCDDVSVSYQSYESCAATQNLLNNAESSWVSCNTSANPNTARAAQTKWIKYDFGDVYKFQGTRVWNYNVLNETNKGFKNVIVDYSTDGTTWQALGTTYLWQQAPGTTDYSGFAGPNMNNLKARYILISAIDTWGNTCAGFSKITFDASLCSNVGTACDDKDPLTKHDQFDANCNCRGVNIDCATDTLKLVNLTLSEAAYKAKKEIVATSLVPNPKNISFTAGNDIVLLPGFNVAANSVFSANIADCIQTAYTQNNVVTNKPSDSTATEFSAKDTVNNKTKKIIFRLNKPAQVLLTLKDANQQVIVTIIDDYYQNLGTQTKFLPTNKLSKGQYWVELKVDKEVLRESLVVDN